MRLLWWKLRMFGNINFIHCGRGKSEQGGGRTLFSVIEKKKFLPEVNVVNRGLSLAKLGLLSDRCLNIIKE